MFETLGRPELPERETCQLRVLGSFRRELTSVQKEVVGCHATKLWLSLSCEFFLQHVERISRAISLSPSWRAGATRAASECEVRAELPLFFRYLDGKKIALDCFSEAWKFPPGFHPDPKDTRGVRRGKKSKTTETDLHGWGSDARQCPRDSFHVSVWLLTDEFQGHVQRFGFDPPRLGREAFHAFGETGDPFADGIVKVKSYEKAHTG